MAEGEGEKVCAQMVCENYVWAALSDDSDMFVYGCPRVLRQYTQERGGGAMLYMFDEILESNEMTTGEFRKAAICMGTDYNREHKTPQSFAKLLTYRQMPELAPDFYTFVGLPDLDHVDKMFDLSSEDNREIKITEHYVGSGRPDYGAIREHMQKYGNFLYDVDIDGGSSNGKCKKTLGIEWLPNSTRKYLPPPPGLDRIV